VAGRRDSGIAGWRRAWQGPPACPVCGASDGARAFEPAQEDIGATGGNVECVAAETALEPDARDSAGPGAIEGMIEFDGAFTSADDGRGVVGDIGERREGDA
jgi:hypothetical protein